MIKDKYTYTSPDISVRITKEKDSTHDSKEFTYCLADIHVAEIDCIQTGFPTAGIAGSVERLTKENRAILGINGDYYLSIDKGLIVRNGKVLQSDEGTNDICVLYRDGRMDTLEPEEYQTDDIIAEDPYQVWSFGPALLDADGMPKEEFNTSSGIAKNNPRTAIGYFEPGHYCFVVVEGRMMNNSAGASLRALAELMADLGCRAAYNLDGGASSSMACDGKLITKPSGGGRPVSDIVMICDPTYG